MGVSAGGPASAGSCDEDESQIWAHLGPVWVMFDCWIPWWWFLAAAVVRTFPPHHRHGHPLCPSTTLSGSIRLPGAADGVGVAGLALNKGGGSRVFSAQR